MSDVAEAVAISPSALYRHFRGKEDLLLETVRSQFLAFAADVRSQENESMHDLVVRHAEAVLRRRGIGVLWQRESRRLSPERRGELRDLLVGVERGLDTRLRTERPGLSDLQSDLLSWAALAALMSVAFQRVKLPHDDYRDLLADIGDAIVAIELEQDPEDRPPDEPRGSTGGQPRGATEEPVTTADRLMSSATRLFAERGFQAVGIDEVAADVGIAGPSVYRHFGGKQELLERAMSEGARVLLSEQSEICSTGAPPEEMLLDLVRSYVDFSFDHRHVVDLMITEISSLPTAQARQAVAQQREYVGEWVRLLELVHPDLPARHSRVRLQAALTVTNDISRTAHLATRPGTRAAVTAICATTLDLTRLLPPAAPRRTPRH